MKGLANILLFRFQVVVLHITQRLWSKLRLFQLILITALEHNLTRRMLILTDVFDLATLTLYNRALNVCTLGTEIRDCLEITVFRFVLIQLRDFECRIMMIVSFF